MPGSKDNDSFRRDILDLLGSSGPMSSRDIPDTLEDLASWLGLAAVEPAV